MIASIADWASGRVDPLMVAILATFAAIGLHIVLTLTWQNARRLRRWFWIAVGAYAYARMLLKGEQAQSRGLVDHTDPPCERCAFLRSPIDWEQRRIDALRRTRR